VLLDDAQEGPRARLLAKLLGHSRRPTADEGGGGSVSIAGRPAPPPPALVWGMARCRRITRAASSFAACAVLRGDIIVPRGPKAMPRPACWPELISVGRPVGPPSGRPGAGRLVSGAWAAIVDRHPAAPRRPEKGSPAVGASRSLAVSRSASVRPGDSGDRAARSTSLSFAGQLITSGATAALVAGERSPCSG